MTIFAGWTGYVLNQTVSDDPTTLSSAAVARMDAWVDSVPFATSLPGYRVGRSGGRLDFTGGNNTTVAVGDGATIATRGVVTGDVFYGDNLGNSSAAVESHAFMSIYADFAGPSVTQITYTRDDDPPAPAEPRSWMLTIGGLAALIFWRTCVPRY